MRDDLSSTPGRNTGGRHSGGNECDVHHDDTSHDPESDGLGCGRADRQTSRTVRHLTSRPARPPGPPPSRRAGAACGR
jgi:hypothetical protein